MEQATDSEDREILENKNGFLKSLGIFLYALIASVALTFGESLILGPTVQKPQVGTAFLFGLLAVIPLIFFLDQKVYMLKKKIVFFLIGCTFSQALAYFAGLILFILMTFGLSLIQNSELGKFALDNMNKIMLVPTLFIPMIAGMSVILLSALPLLQDSVSWERKYFLLTIYCVCFPFLLLNFVDITEFVEFSNIDSGGVETYPFLVVSFFWQFGMFYFLTEIFSKLQFITHSEIENTRI